MSATPPPRRCAIYTRKSSEEGLEQAFNSLDAQREACEAFIKSQAHEGWVASPVHYDDGGFSGGNTDRPALVKLMADIDQGRVDIVLVYKVDRLSRSLADFVRLIERFDACQISFVSVTQQFNTSTSMGRLTLNVLLSFAQFEREVTGERIRDKIAASKKKGMWMGGAVPLGYDRIDKQLVVNDTEASLVRHIYTRYVALGCVRKLKAELDRDGRVSKARPGSTNRPGGTGFSRGALYTILKNPIYRGKIAHRKELHPGQHIAIVDQRLWQAVQNLLHRNRLKQRTRSNSRSPSLLAGFLFDDRGNPMSPTQSHRGARRYRYYICQAVLQYKGDAEGSVVRVPAECLESIVSGQLIGLLTDGPRLIDRLAVSGLPAAEQETLLQRAAGLVAHWKGGPTSQQIALLQAWQPQITVSRSELQITLPAKNLLESLKLPTRTSESATIRLSVAVVLRRSGIETKLVIPNGPPPEAHKASVTALRGAVLKALEWNQGLLSGRFAGVNDVAAAEGVNPRFISQRLQLAWLPPDIMERIIEGRIPESLTLERFKNLRLPSAWSEQREFFGLE